jgi:hypothetical protein
MNVRNLGYLDTLEKIDVLKKTIRDIDGNIYSQIPQGIVNEFDKSKDILLNWIEEIEITLTEYISVKNE